MRNRILPEPPSGNPRGSSTSVVTRTAVLCGVAGVVAAAALAVGEFRRAGASGAEMGPEQAGPFVEVFRRSTGVGYGYRISTASGIVIHQPHVPAVPGHLGFETAHGARRVARLVAHRIEAGIFPPAISRRDLDSIGVRTSARSPRPYVPASRRRPETIPYTGEKSNDFDPRS